MRIASKAADFANPQNYAFWKDVAYVVDMKTKKKYRIHSVDMPDDLAYLSPFELDIPLEISPEDKLFDKLVVGYLSQIESGEKLDGNEHPDFAAYNEHGAPLTENKRYLKKK